MAQAETCSQTGMSRQSEVPPAVLDIRDAYLAERREEGWPVDDRLIETVERFAQERMYPLEWGSYTTSSVTFSFAPDREAVAVLLVSLCFYTGDVDSPRVERVRRGAADVVKGMPPSITLPVMRRFADQLDETSLLFRSLHEEIEKKAPTHPGELKAVIEKARELEARARESRRRIRSAEFEVHSTRRYSAAEHVLIRNRFHVWWQSGGDARTDCLYSDPRFPDSSRQVCPKTLETSPHLRVQPETALRRILTGCHKAAPYRYLFERSVFDDNGVVPAIRSEDTYSQLPEVARARTTMMSPRWHVDPQTIGLDPDGIGVWTASLGQFTLYDEQHDDLVVIHERLSNANSKPSDASRKDALPNYTVTRHQVDHAHNLKRLISFTLSPEFDYAITRMETTVYCTDPVRAMTGWKRTLQQPFYHLDCIETGQSSNQEWTITVEYEQHERTGIWLPHTIMTVAKRGSNADSDDTRFLQWDRVFVRSLNEPIDDSVFSEPVRLYKDRPEDTAENAADTLPEILFTRALPTEPVVPDTDSGRVRSGDRTMCLHVVDEADRAIRNAVVRGTIWASAGRQWSVEAPSDASGKAKIALPSESLVFQVIVKTPGRETLRTTWDTAHGTKDFPREFTFRPKKAVSIHGFVRDEEGGPIKGALVHLVDSKLDERTDPRRVTSVHAFFDVTVETDVEGRWLCRCVPPGIETISTRVSHPDYVTTSVSEGPGRRTLEIETLRSGGGIVTMQPGVVLIGSVVDPDGRPVPHAAISLGKTPNPLVGTLVSTDADGLFQFPRLRPADNQIVTLSVEGRFPQKSRHDLRPGMRPLALHLEPGLPLRIRVVDQDGRPVPNVSLEMRCQGMWLPRVLKDGHGRPATDVDGRFFWSEAPIAPVSVRFLPFASDRFPANAYMSVRRTLQPGNDEHTVTLPPALRIHGRVIDCDTKKPIPRVTIMRGLVSRTGEPSVDRRSTHVGRDGRYYQDFTSWREQRGMFVRLEADGYIPWVSPEIPLGQSEAELDVEMTRGRGPSGVVLRTDGRPAVGAVLGIATPSNKLRQGYTNQYAVYQEGLATPGATTDKDGRFQLPAEIGDYDACVWCEYAGAAIVRRDDLIRQPIIQVQPFAQLEVIASEKTGAEPSKVRTSIVLESVKDSPELNGRYIERKFSETVRSSGVVRWSPLPAGVYAITRRETDTTESPPVVNVWRCKKRVTATPGASLTLDLRDEPLWESEVSTQDAP